MKTKTTNNICGHSMLLLDHHTRTPLTQSTMSESNHKKLLSMLITESLRLDKTLKIIEYNHNLTVLS